MSWSYLATMHYHFTYLLISSRFRSLYDTAVPKHTFIYVQNSRALYICRIDVCIDTAPDLPLKSTVSWPLFFCVRMYREMHISRPAWESRCEKNKTDHISVRPSNSLPPTPKKNLLFIRFYQSSPGETVQRSHRYILIHNTTFELIRQKDVEHFIFFYQGAKKNIKIWSKNIGDFLWILPILHSDV